jgi:N-acyl-D-aspartate/D-glutamate deacylase
MRRRAAVALAVLLPGALLAQAPAAPSYDVLIRNGRVFDGSGNPWIRADVGIRGERIVAVGDLRGAGAREIVDAGSLYVAPGFIDTHSHAGGGLASERLGHAQPLLAQGITTVFVNPDGGGPVDLAKQREALLKAGIGVNAAQFVPHGSVRQAVLGMADRRPDASELERMKALVRRGMQDGAVGLSSGPFYAPGSYSDTAELVALASVAAEFGGAYQSHIRDESDYTIGVLAAVDEVVRVAREARLRAVVTHVKALGPNVWGFGSAIVQRIERARSEGLEVFADQYPYIASATGLSAALLPRWAQEGGEPALLRRLADAATRPKIRAAMVENLARRGGAARIQFRRAAHDAGIEGRTLEQVAQERGGEPVDVAMALLEKGGASIVSFNMHEEDVRTLMRPAWTMTASDGDLVPPGEGVPHPRSNGTFPRKLRRYAIEEPVVSLEHAIRSMTALPARVYRLADRGEVRAGAFADLVVFDLARVRDRATYSEPHRLAEGMLHVFVNGRAAIRDAAFTGERNARVLRHAAH